MCREERPTPLMLLCRFQLSECETPSLRGSSGNGRGNGLARASLCAQWFLSACYGVHFAGSCVCYIFVSRIVCPNFAFLWNSVAVEKSGDNLIFFALKAVHCGLSQKDSFFFFNGGDSRRLALGVGEGVGPVSLRGFLFHCRASHGS